MKKKIVCILVCTLFIASIPLVSGLTIQKTLTPGVVDQQQPNTPEVHFLENGMDHWQQFVNHGKTIEEVHVHMGQYFGGSGPITLSIQKPIGNKLCFKTLEVYDIPDHYQDWVVFDVPNTPLVPGDLYYIVIEFGAGSEYMWSGSHNDPYPAGASSHPDADWDYAFKTYVDKTNPINNLQMLPPDLTTWDGVYFYWNDTTEVRGEWEIENKILARQLHNCDPCLLLHPITAPKWDFSCRFRVNSSVDNDYIGFVFGYVNKSQFYILDWKQSLGKELEGFTVRKINASSPNLLWRNEFKGDVDTNYMTILDHQWDEGEGWVNYIWYEFHLEFDRGVFTLNVKDGSQVLYDVTINDGQFQKGRVGFYDCSQTMAEFTDIIVEYSACSLNLNTNTNLLSNFKSSMILNQLLAKPFFYKILQGL